MAHESSETTLSALPLRASVAYPNLMMPVTGGRPASIAAVETSLAAALPRLGRYVESKLPVGEN